MPKASLNKHFNVLMNFSFSFWSCVEVLIKKNTCLDQNLRRGRQFFSMFNFGQVWPTSQRAKHSIFFFKKTLICIVYGCYHQNSSFYRKEKPYSLPVNLLVQLTTAGCIS